MGSPSRRLQPSELDTLESMANAGMTQAQIASHLRVSQCAVSKRLSWMRKGRPKRTKTPTLEVQLQELVKDAYQRQMLRELK